MEFHDHSSLQIDTGLLAWPGENHWATMWLDFTCLLRILHWAGLQIQIQESLISDLRDELPQSTDLNSKPT